jgi:hypothetical protein
MNVASRFICGVAAFGLAAAGLSAQSAASRPRRPPRRRAWPSLKGEDSR